MLKINELLKQQIGEIMREEMEFPANTLVTITSVSTSPDLHYARINVSIIPDDEQEKVLHWLNARAKEFQKILNQKIVLRCIPKISFMIDEKEKKAFELDQILDNIK